MNLLAHSLQLIIVAATMITVTVVYFTAGDSRSQTAPSSLPSIVDLDPDAEITPANGSGAAAGNPSYRGSRRACKKPIHETHLEKCIADEIVRALKSFSHGSKSDGLPAMDPVHMTGISFCRGHGPVRANIDFATSTLEGVSHIDEILSVRYVPSKSMLEFSSHHPYVRKKGVYNLTGSFTELYAVGSGNANIEMRDVVIHHVLTWRRSHGEIRLAHYKGSVRPQGMVVHYENLRAETREELPHECMQQRKEENVNQFFNQHWEILYNALSPSVDFAFSFVYRDYMDALLRRLDLNVLTIGEE